MRTTLVTVVIPCHNQGAYLADAIRSALAQDLVEVIVVDDGSTDRSAAMAAQFRQVHVVRQENRGVASARNAGARAARGEFVVFLDADDRLREGAIARLRSAIQQSPAASFVFGRFDVIDDTGAGVRSPTPPRPQGTPYESLLQSNFICCPGTVLYRREAFLRAGGFPIGLDPAADYAVYLQLARTSDVLAIDDVVADYRMHQGNMSGRADRMLVSTLRAHARERREARTGLLRRHWAAGRTHWRRWYGSQLVDQIRAEWRTRNVAGLTRDVTVLARYAPGVLIAHTMKKLALVIGVYRTRYSTERSSS